MQSSQVEVIFGRKEGSGSGSGNGKLPQSMAVFRFCEIQSREVLTEGTRRLLRRRTEEVNAGDKAPFTFDVYLPIIP